MSRADQFPPPANELPAEPLEAVVRAMRNLKFGAIVLTMHDGRVVQIEVTERKRFT